MANILITKRLILRELNTGDAQFVLELLNSPGFLHYVGDRNLRSIPDAEKYIINGPLKSYQSNGFGVWIFTAKNGTPMGICGLIRREGLEDVDIGFAMLPLFEGNGFAFEAAAAVMEIGKTKFGLPRIVAITTEENLRSVNLLKKIGLEFEKFIYLPGDPEKLMLFGN